MKTFSIEKINDLVGGSLVGNLNLTISGVEHVELAESNHLTFIGENKYAKMWPFSRASAAIISAHLDMEPGEGRALIRVDQADLAMAQVLQLFNPDPPLCEPGVHPSAVVDPTAELGEGVAVGPNCYIGPAVGVGAGTKLYANVSLLDGSTIGAGSILYPGTVVRERCRIGHQCILHPNVSIGADGFGYQPSADGQGLVKIPHIGTVVIGDGVEIGAGSCVDRGKFSATVIGDGTKIDNLVQVAHNCNIGRSCVIAASTGIGGSVILGDGVMIGGGAAIKDHVTIGKGARLAGRSGVIRDVAPGETVSGLPAADHLSTLQQWAALKKLPEFLKRWTKK